MLMRRTTWRRALAFCLVAGCVFGAPAWGGEDFPLGEVTIVVGPAIDDPAGVESYVGVRVQSAPGQPVSDIGLAQTSGGLRVVLLLPALPPDAQIMIEDALSLSLSLTDEPFPLVGLPVHASLPSFSVQSALDGGTVTALTTGMIQRCALEAFDDFPPVPLGGGVAGNPCPDDNCTEYLKPWLEKMVSAFRKRGLRRMAELLQELIDKKRVVVDVNNTYRSMIGVGPDECAGVYYNPFIGKKYFFISPACLEESSKAQMAVMVMAGAMVGVDKELRKLDLDDPIDRMVLEMLQMSIILDSIDETPEKTEKFLEMLKKVMEAAGLRPMATMFECFELARMYRVSEDAELLKKLKQCIRRMIAETIAILTLPPEQLQQLLEHIKARLDRLTELLEAKDWKTIEEEFGITRDCLDPTFVASMACPAEEDVQPECGSVDAGGCFKPHETGACNDPLLCMQVCEADPFCCATMWDEECVDAAQVLAGEVCAQGSCCDPGGGPGCDDPLCCQMVCDVVPHCCTDIWDETCVKTAAVLCPQTCETYAIGCIGSLNDCFGSGDGPGCADGDCCTTVCAIDPMCCDVAWDLACAAQASVVCEAGPSCGDGSGGSCCSPHAVPTCDDGACCGAVCESDAFCCAVEWDQLCVLAAQELCGCKAPEVCGAPGAAGCLESHAGGGCDDAVCCGAVCALDPFCCDFDWDDICVAEAKDFCAACPQDCVSSETFQPPPDGQVDGADLAVLLGDWGRCEGCCADTVTSATFAPPADGVVDGADLAVLLGAWGDPGCE